MPVHIDDPDDLRIAAFRNVRERDLVGREGLFIAEGEVVLRVLLDSPLCRPALILIAESRAESLAPLLARAPVTVPVYTAGQEVLDAIAGFHLHRGILALGAPIARPSVADLLASLPEQALVVGLFGIGNHDNMGGIFRNAAAFGANAVILASDCCDPFYRKAIRVSVGACLATPFAWATADEDAVAQLEQAGFKVFALSPGGKLALDELQRPARAAVLFGAEGSGLPEKVLARATSVRIPMAGKMDSLNVATSSGIVLQLFAKGPAGA